MPSEAKKEKKKRSKRTTIRLGERDEEGKLLTPHTHYGIINDLKYMFQKYGSIKRAL